MSKLYNDSVQVASEKIQWQRDDVAAKIVDFEQARDKQSQRQFAIEQSLSRSTLQHWLARKESIDASAALIAFLESPEPEGTAFVHRIVTTAHFTFTKDGVASLHNVSTFLKLSGLLPFVASSYTSQQRVSNKMVGLISIGKPDYDAIEIFRSKPDFFTKALGISGCPSSPTIRQRIDLIGQAADIIIIEESAALVRSKAPAISPIETSAGPYIPLDIDVSPFDNSKTHKEGVSRTYKSYDGYAPIFSYLGTEGYLINLELREGKQHCQKNTPQFIGDTLNYAQRITDQPILIRLDSGNDSQDNFPDTRFENVDFIIKRNLRRESRQAWAELAKDVGEQRICRSGKSVWVGKTSVGVKGEKLPFPIVFEVTERRTKKGQELIFPEIEVDTYWCSVEQLTAQEVIELYHDHGTSEQFHSEIKSDMDLERLPSGSFTSNSLVLQLDMLRIIGQQSLEEAELSQLPGSRSKKVSRRRIRTVM